MNDILNKLKVIQEQISNCKKCDLHVGRIQTVFSRGNISAKVIIVGEGPGQHEDEQGKPFVGVSGQLLDKAIQEIGFDPENDIYVCNIIKCRPPGNRKPTDEESNECFPYLEEQIKLIKPNVLVALGATAMNNLINTTVGITKMHGTFTKTVYGLVMPTYHPSYILRSGGVKSELYSQFKNDLLSAFNKSKSQEDYLVLEEAAYYDLDCDEE